MTERISAFTDDALGTLDAVGVAELVRSGAASPQEVAAAALERIARVDPVLHAVSGDLLPEPRIGADTGAPLYGVPFAIKDNTVLAGLPTGMGSEAFRGKPAAKDDIVTQQLLSSGVTVVGKTRLPEFGFNASTEFRSEPACVNPWNTDYSVGASSGGSAALVASGALPIAHANDGGGSIRIPAAAAGLVGLKPTRGRHRDGDTAKHLPINIISEGVLTRSVRDTAAYFAAAEDFWRNPALPPVGLVLGPAKRRLRVGLLLETVDESATVDAQTRAAVENVARALEAAGHIVEPIALPVSQQFADDFLQYWSLTAELATSTGKLLLDKSFDSTKTDGLTAGLRAAHRKQFTRTPGALRRLRRATREVAAMYDKRELVLSPVLAHTTPRIGHLSPNQPYEDLVRNLRAYVAFTPLQNIAGTPAISLPLGVTDDGLPIGVQLSGAHGDERTLLETAFELEPENGFRTLAG
ncbi:amidase [Jongsikchunia kroppenstedtii]|uniref:amidase n=1 Tax=Jongsikchunia kroppenstedtii TaxID=1121721 RepID=UPI000376EBA2|nr:amidase [Jongsikchunia kroppenstedtii]